MQVLYLLLWGLLVIQHTTIPSLSLASVWPSLTFRPGIIQISSLLHLSAELPLDHLFNAKQFVSCFYVSSPSIPVPMEVIKPFPPKQSLRYLNDKRMFSCYKHFWFSYNFGIDDFSPSKLFLMIVPKESKKVQIFKNE